MRETAPKRTEAKPHMVIIPMGIPPTVQTGTINLVALVIFICQAITAVMFVRYMILNWTTKMKTPFLKVIYSLK